MYGFGDDADDITTKNMIGKRHMETAKFHYDHNPVWYSLNNNDVAQ